MKLPNNTNICKACHDYLLWFIFFSFLLLCSLVNPSPPSKHFHFIISDQMTHLHPYVLKTAFVLVLHLCLDRCLKLIFHPHPPHSISKWRFHTSKLRPWTAFLVKKVLKSQYLLTEVTVFSVVYH